MAGSWEALNSQTAPSLSPSITPPGESPLSQTMRPKSSPYQLCSFLLHVPNSLSSSTKLARRENLYSIAPAPTAQIAVQTL